MQSRYYNPEIGRFINADAFASTGQGFIGNNMFAYCLNNPVNLIDPNGMNSHNSAEPWNCTCATCMGYDRFVGIGVQFEVSVGSYECGVELIIYFDQTVCGGEEPIVALYAYEGACVDFCDLYKSPDIANTIGLLTTALQTNAASTFFDKAGLVMLQEMLFNDLGISASVVAIWGYSQFNSPNHYEGAFSTYYGSWKNIKVSYSYSDYCWVIGLGATSATGLHIGFGQTNYQRIW